MRSKILGLIYDESQEKFHNLVLLKEKLPMAVKHLDWIMINLCSIFLELVKRENIIFPYISLDTIYISLNPQNSLPYIKSYVDIQIPKTQRKEYANNQMIKILQQLNYEHQLYNGQSSNLQEIQDILLQKIGYSNRLTTYFTKEFQSYLRIESKIIIYEQKEFTRVDSITVPSFIYNVQEKEIVMKTYKQQQEYQLREVDLIEKFTSSNQPYLYSYIRYSNILILFLKKHQISFCRLITDCFSPKKNQVDHYSDQLKLKGFLKIFHSMVKSLENLHSHQIVHRDLKPDNIMFDFQDQIKNLDDLLKNDITCVIIDYDRSKKLVYSEQEYTNTYYKGNLIFKPPEDVENYLPQYDIWQMGFLWLISLTKAFIKQPNKFTSNMYLRNIFDKKNSNYNQFFQEVNYHENHIQINDDHLQIILQMIEFDPKNRPNAEIVKNKIEQFILSLN